MTSPVPEGAAGARRGFDEPRRAGVRRIFIAGCGIVRRPQPEESHER